MGNTFGVLFYLFQSLNLHCFFMEFSDGILMEVDSVASLIGRHEPNVVSCKGLGGVDGVAFSFELT